MKGLMSIGAFVFSLTLTLALVSGSAIAASDGIPPDDVYTIPRAPAINDKDRWG